MPRPLVSRDAYYSKYKTRLINFSKLLSLQTKKVIREYIHKGLLHPQYMDFLSDLTKKLQKVYPDRWDIQLQLAPRLVEHVNTYGTNHSKTFMVVKGITIETIYIVIWFPNVTVTNGTDNIEITDLMIRLPIDISRSDRSYISKEYEAVRAYFQPMQGARLSATMEQILGRYAHSHLAGRMTSRPNEPVNILEHDNIHHIHYGGFCTGSETYINQIFSLLNSGFDLDTFELLLHQIQTYIEWESVEGGPYKLMSQIAGRNYEIDGLVSIDRMRDFWEYAKSELVHRSRREDNFNSRIDWKISNGKYVVVENGKLDNFLKSISRCVNVFMDNTGRYFVSTGENIISSNLSMDLDSKEWQPFRGEKKYFRVLPNPSSSEVINLTTHVHPKLKRYVKHKLEYQANKVRLEEGGIERFDQLIYT